ncbi:helix-turn-helix domain-containing protein [Asticcacaulis sp. YBE204]|uniref:helix-turn-helix domain-containing protein n=1 Tax=Asticcacaulis sp. YBE204 TaxID=1282363 RepID=UPI0012DC11D3|nr:helix-turn-helix domain-containing protein [Asticcacaulis sp. YBE204]
MAKRKLHPEEVKARLRINHGSMTAFEEANGLNRGATNDALRGKSKSTLKVIAQSLGISETSIKAGPKPGTCEKSISDFSENHCLNDGAK